MINCSLYKSSGIKNYKHNKTECIKLREILAHSFINTFGFCLRSLHWENIGLCLSKTFYIFLHIFICIILYICRNYQGRASHLSVRTQVRAKTTLAIIVDKIKVFKNKNI